MLIFPRSAVVACMMFVLMPTSQFSLANDFRDNETCGIQPGRPLTNAYGPYDFTNPDHKEKLPIVLGAHFTSRVERLLGGTGNVTAYADIDYTLRAIPNYHRALYAMSRLQLRDNSLKVQSYDFYSAHCYFERAIYFQPEDPVVRMLYGLHLHRSGKLQEALTHYLEAIKIQPDNPEFNYNIGLLYVDLKKQKKAKKHADAAREGGYPLEGLQKKIARMKQG